MLEQSPSLFGFSYSAFFRPSDFGFRPSPLPPAFICFAAVLWLFAFAPMAHTQEALRMSLAGTDAAEARRRANATLDYYNLKLGTTEIRFGASLGLEYNDNVLLTAHDQLGDFIFHPGINAQMLLQMTEKNALNLNLGMGYSAYVFHPELNRIFIGPG